MAKLEKFQCGICYKLYPNLEAIDNEVGIKNGEYTEFHADVCLKCIKALWDKIQELKPEFARNQNE